MTTTTDIAPIVNLADFDLILVNTSAGKDSQAMMDYLVELADAAGVRDRLVAAHADLGRCEWSGTRKLAEEQAAHYGMRFEAISRDQDLLDQVAQRGMWPDNKNRYCTSDHKRDQIQKIVTRLGREHKAAGGTHFRVLNCMGIRWEESAARAKKAWTEDNKRASTKSRTVTNWHPILDWTVGMVWDRIADSGVRHHEAYDLGMTRLSCVFCVFAPKSALKIAGRHNRELLAEYVAVEQAIDHTFRKDEPIADVQAELEAEDEADIADENATRIDDLQADPENASDEQAEADALVAQYGEGVLDRRAAGPQVGQLVNYTSHCGMKLDDPEPHQGQGRVVKLHGPTPIYELDTTDLLLMVDELEVVPDPEQLPRGQRQLSVLSIFDTTGEWALPWAEAGHLVTTIDVKDNMSGMMHYQCDVNDFCVAWVHDHIEGPVDVILAAVPCTDFTVSGAQYWPEKDADGRTAASVRLVHQILGLVDYLKPSVWAIENPGRGRLAPKKGGGLVPELERFGPWTFEPHHYGDAYTKNTGLWGTFNQDLPRNDVEPVRACKAGSWLMQLGGKSEKTKAARSVTPAGFARAFYLANHDLPEQDDDDIDFYDSPIDWTGPSVDDLEEVEA